MEENNKPILIKHGKDSQYFFFEDKIHKRKANDIIEISLGEIEEITYNKKFHIGDFLLMLIYVPHSFFYMPKAFVITFKSNLKLRRICLKLNEKEYLLLKERFKKPIKVI